MLLERLLLVAELYLFWFRSQYNETETTNRKSILLSHLNELVNTRINSDTTIDIADTFIRIFGSITKLMGFRIPHIINSAHINEF